MTDITESSLVEHAPCEHCGSSDGKAVYDDGHTYCFVCERYTGADGSAVDNSVNTSLVQGVCKALGKRRIARKTCQKYGYMVGKHKGTPVQIANYRKKGEIVAQHLRYPDKDFAWLGEPKGVEMWGQHLWASKGKRIVITEGEIDCMTIAQVFGLSWPVVSLPSGIKSAKKSILHNLEFLDSFDEIVLAFDDDAPGREGVAEVAPLFTPGKVKVMSYEGFKDANEMYLSEQGSKLGNSVYRAKDYRPDGIVSGADLIDDILREPVPGIPMLYPKLSEMLDGCRKGELYLWTAGSGIGKSTAVTEIAYDLKVNKGAKVGVIYLEENRKKTGDKWLSIYLNKPIFNSREGVTIDQIMEAHHHVLQEGFWLYDHWGSTSTDALLGKIRYMALALGVDWVVLDHISIVVSGLSEDEGERKTIDIFMTRLRSLIEETGIGVQAIVHLKRKGGQGTKSYNDGGRVSLTDLRGSASLEQLSDAVIALERDQQGEDPNISTIRILKNRPTGITGVADTLKYNPTTGRLLPFQEEDVFQPEPQGDF